MRTRDLRHFEPGVRDMLALARQLLRRGFERPLVTVALTLAATLLLLTAVFWFRPAHASEVVLRASEMDRDPDTMPNLKRDLPAYVGHAVFTSRALLPILRRHGLYPKLVENNPTAAIESFREDIEIEVFHNYFTEVRKPGDVPRSVRVVVRYRSTDRKQSIAVTRELGALIVEQERRNRRNQTEAALLEATLALERAESSVSATRTEIVVKRLEVERADADPMHQVELVSLLGSLQGKQQRLDEVRARKAALGLGYALESQGSGLSFQVVDAGEIPRSAELEPRDFLAFGVGGFAGLLWFAALTVGSFRNKRGAA